MHSNGWLSTCEAEGGKCFGQERVCSLISRRAHAPGGDFEAQVIQVCFSFGFQV